MELGIYTFADMALAGDRSKLAHQRITELMEEIELADQVGLDVFGIGEHHRPDYAVSSPAIILAAAAVRTKQIRLTSAVTVLSSDDPVRVFQDFATVDQLSAGRAEIMVGRGSFIESFPLFGYDLKDYDELFSEKLELLLKLNKEEVIKWEGQLTPSIGTRGVYPRPFQRELPVWIAVGGTPSSAVRAGTLGIPMAVAIIGGMPERFVSFTKLYKESAAKAGHDVSKLQLSINSHVYVSENLPSAKQEFYAPYSQMMNRIGRERGWPPVTNSQLDMLAQPDGSLLIGSVDQVVDKILYEHELFGNTRFLAQTSMGTLPHKFAMRSIELFGNKVAPKVRKALKK